MGHVHITTNKDKKLKSITIITLTLLATTTVHAGALAEMSGSLAEQQKIKLASLFVDSAASNGKKVPFEDAYHQSELMLNQLNGIAKQKGKSCLLIAKEWSDKEKLAFDNEIKEEKDQKVRQSLITYANSGRGIAVDYIKYKCLESSDFLNK